MKARKRQIAFYKGWGRMAVKRGRAVTRMKRVVKGDIGAGIGLITDLNTTLTINRFWV